ncbi:zinc finger domain-containing protein [Streptomyces sp. NPDC002308]
MPIRPENRDRYPKDWPTISLLIRTGRAAGRCECLGECGRGTHPGRCPNVNGGRAYGTGSRVILTVAHLDHTPENCNPENLRAMCQGCHLHYDREHHRQTAAATRWAARAAAGQLDLESLMPDQPAPALSLPQLAVACPACGAAPGALCTSHSGTRPRRSDVHQARTAAHAAFVDSVEIQITGGCGVCDTEEIEMCAACGRCRCHTHERCVRPAA